MCKTYISGYARIKMIAGTLELQASFLLPDDTLFTAHRCFPGTHQSFAMMRTMSTTILDWNSVPIHAYMEGTLLSHRATSDGATQILVDLLHISTVTQGSKVLFQDIEKNAIANDAAMLSHAA